MLPHHNALLEAAGQETFTLDDLLQPLLQVAPRVLPYAAPVWRLLQEHAAQGSRILYEGAQGTLLDNDFGTYPYVTSSSATAGGASTGSGVGPNRRDRIVGIVKAYTTRVGAGPFPTELFDEQGDWLRAKGFEFGTTTGRPRRVGWYDAPITRYATRINGITDLVLTKLDVLTGLEQIPVCVAYDVEGRRFDEVPVNQTDFHHAQPILEHFPGWSEDISGCRTFEDLPQTAQDYVLALERMSGTRISVIGVGPSRDQVIVRHDLVD
jgi:adenylosuccinate synthase